MCRPKLYFANSMLLKGLYQSLSCSFFLAYTVQLLAIVTELNLPYVLASVLVSASSISKILQPHQTKIISQSYCSQLQCGLRNK